MMHIKRYCRELREVDLTKPATPIDVKPMPGPEDQTTIGDMHANAVKFFYTLIQQNFINMSNEDQHAFLVIYLKPVDALTREDIDAFHAILNRIIVNPKAGTLFRLIGDELCDRGSNDYFILKIFEKLRLAGVNIETTASNHAMEFVECLEKNRNKNEDEFDFKPPRLHGYGHGRSMQNLAALLEKGLVTREEIYDIYDTHYKPCMRALSYSISPDRQSITIYSHAGIGLETIRALALQLGVVYQDGTIDELAQTIDQINREYAIAVKNNFVHKLYTHQEIKAAYESKYVPEISNPLVRLCWNRKYLKLKRPPIAGQEESRYNIAWVHGHDPEDPNDPRVSPPLDIPCLQYDSRSEAKEHILNMDNVFGISMPEKGRELSADESTCVIMTAAQASPILDYASVPTLSFDEWKVQRDQRVAGFITEPSSPTSSDSSSDPFDSDEEEAGPAGPARPARHW